MEKRLISKVFDHELLYAVDTVHYRDRHMRALAWSDIAKDLGIPASQCKDMWRKLRNCYLNAINRRQTKNIPKWKYEEEMSFLLPYIDVRSSENDSELHSQSSGLSNVSVTYHEGSGDNPMLDERGEDSTEMMYPETSGFVPKAEPEDEQMEMMLRRKSNFRGLHRLQAGLPYDETDMFFRSICETVKRLTPVDQARIKMELCKLVYEAEIKQLESQYEEAM